jgi:3-hydroxybutyryl-CoA dehydrogenase
MNRVAVVGAGTMGAGIAQACAEAGYTVILFDIDAQILNKAVMTIDAQLHTAVKKERLTTEERDLIFGRIHKTTDWQELADVEYVTEAIIEKTSIKQQVFSKLESIVKEEVIFATNSSGLNITEIASVLTNPERLVGTHYFYPVPKMKLVEIVRGAQTADKTVKTALTFAESLGKKAIEVKESPLFVFNRILIPMINEAIFVLQEGICRKEEIDEAMILGASHQIGPLALADVIGLDTLLYVIETLHTEMGDPKYRPAPLLRQMVRAGNLGRKTGKGFYSY